MYGLKPVPFNTVNSSEGRLVVAFEDNLLAMPAESRQQFAHAGNHEIQTADCLLYTSRRLGEVL